MVEVGVEVPAGVETGMLWVGEEGGVVSLGEDGWGECGRVYVTIFVSL